MAPASKKGSKPPLNTARDRRSSSRQSTPLSAVDTNPPTPQTATPTTTAPPPTAITPSMPKETAYIHTSTSALYTAETNNLETLIEKSSASSTAKASLDPPSAKELNALQKSIKDTVNRFMTKRGEVCDRAMRQLAQKRKERLAMEREQQEASAASAAAASARVKREESEGSANVEGKKKGRPKKRSREEMEADAEGGKGPGGPAGKEEVEEDGEEKGRKELREALPSVGAHGVARQDGVGVHEGAPAPPSPKISPGRPSVDLMDTAASPSDSDASQTDLPSTAPLYERAFGKDPTQFDDPTIYDIRELRDDMTLEEKKEILNVAHWPDSDLHDLTAGEPPDQDFSNTKPANQVNFSTFQAYVEPFIRPFTEEDVAFLKERGDRLTPYVIPQRGQRGYKEVWASEDGMDGIAPPRKQESDPNEARGSMEEMNDDTAETDEISMGPIMNRLLSIIRPSPSTSAKKQEQPAEDADGDINMVNGDTHNDQDQSQAFAGASEEAKPTTQLPPEAPRPPVLNQGDYETIEQRAIQELRHIGFLGPNDVPDFATQNDDEVAARLRTLQHELRRISRVNNIRKARVLELTEERMAMQEYSNIADDLDNQVNAAYLKRNRSLAKPGSKKGSAAGPGRPPLSQAKGVAGVGGAGAAGRGVSDGVRALMQKRRDWIEMVGPVVGFGRPPIPGDEETIFSEGELRRLERGEREVEMGEGDGE